MALSTLDHSLTEGAGRMSLKIAHLTDDAQILPALERDRYWAAYLLCDTEPPYRINARFIGAMNGGQAIAVVLLYRLPAFTVLSTCGDAEGVAAIIARAPNLPPAPFLMVRRADLPALERRYRIAEPVLMLRMVAEADDLPPLSPVSGNVTPLTPNDAPAIEVLCGAETHFTPAMLQHGVFYGAWHHGSLVAVAGTHAIGRHHGVGVIGNVFTHPAHRGRGLATATTSAVVAELARSGIRTIALNVRADNAPAIAVYRRLGFTVYQDFYEGDAALR